VPITVKIQGKDLYDPQTNRFITVKDTTLVLEHSLLSLAKWEAKWHKPYLSTNEKTQEEFIDYLRCMCLTQNYNPNVFYALDAENAKAIADYIADPQTATTFHNKDKKPSREIVTNEIIYYWMTQLNIPFDPCQKWHLNRLFTLIQVASIKSQPPKKMGRKEAAQQRAALNAARKAKYNTRG
jgi:hypothetical protein